MRRGEVWWVEFDPSVGGETRKTRPGIIVSNDLSNRKMNRVVVVPTTTAKLHVIYSAEALVSFGRAPSKAMADQIRTVSKERLSGKIGTLSKGALEDVSDAIRFRLAL